MKIRAARETDLECIGELYQVLFYEMALYQPESFSPAVQSREFLLSVIRGRDADILVAEEEGQVVGFALILLQETPLCSHLIPHRYAYLMDLLVEPGSRSRGAGAGLLDAARNWTVERELDYLELNVLSENIRAYALYRREGFQDARITMRWKPTYL